MPDDDRRWPPMTYWARATVVVLAVVAAARVLLAIGQVLVLLVVALVLALGFQPFVGWLERRGFRRGTAVAIGLTGALAIVGAFFSLVLPGIIRQVGELIEAAPEALAEAQGGSGLLAELNERFDLVARLEQTGRELPGTLLELVGSFTVFVFSALTVLILTIYFTVNLPRMRHGMARLLRPDAREEFEAILAESVQRVGGYVIGQLTVSGIAGVVSFVALVIIGVPFAAALAFFVALTDLVPTVGAIIGAVVATTVAAFSGVGPAVATGIFFLVYQQLENYVIQPRVMGRAINMSAPVVILALLIGGSLLGVVGALLAIPAAAVLKVAFRELYLEDRIAVVEEEDRKRTAELAAPAADLNEGPD
jgi:predicted PurR-regulated permease PerM